MMKELDTYEVYLFDGGDSDAEIYRFAEGTPFGPYVRVETTSGAYESSFVEAHSPDTAARFALALLARMESDEAAPAYIAAIRALTHFIEEEEKGRDFKIGEHVEVFDESYGDLEWTSATVVEYSRHGGYFVRNYWDKLKFYSPANIRKVEQGG